MKKEYLFFLVLVLAAAIVTGATIGLISNFHYITHLNPASSSQIEPVNHETATQPSAQPNAEFGEAVQPSVQQSSDSGNEVQKIAVVNQPASAGEQGYLVLSGEEKELVVNMLVSLGADRDGDYSEFIRSFQKQKSLTPTGSLDSLTLNAIILEVTRQRAVNLVKG